MIIGISKEYLQKKLDSFDGLSGDVVTSKQAMLEFLIDECKELDPWLTIDNAPKDKELLLSSSEQLFVGEWCDQHSRWEDNCGCEIYPDKYKLLTEDPK